MAFLVCCAVCLTSANADDKPSVVSINLCTDRLVLALADARQIVSLSYVAADSNSMIKTAASTVKLNHGRLEELLLLDADYFLASDYDDPKLLKRLGEFGKKVRRFKAERTVDQSKANIAMLAEILNQNQKGELMIEKLNQIDQLEKIEGSPRTLLLGANNYISGRNTLASNVIEIMGYKNIADEANIIDYGRISMEQVVELNPEVIVVSKYSGDYSRAQSVLQHPVLKDMSRSVKVINVPTREWICGDQALYDAAARLSVLQGR